MRKCSVCKRWGTLATLANGTVICSKCIASLVADGFSLSATYRCAVCDATVPLTTAKSDGLDIKVCEVCHHKHFPKKGEKHG